MSEERPTYEGDRDISRRGKSPRAKAHVAALSKKAAQRAAFKNVLDGRNRPPITLRKFSFEDSK